MMKLILGMPEEMNVCPTKGGACIRETDALHSVQFCLELTIYIMKIDLILHPVTYILWTLKSLERGRLKFGETGSILYY